MLKETKQIDRIEVIDLSVIQVREITIITKDDVEIARTFHRWSFNKGDDLGDMPKEVKDIANIIFK
jgi:hypothetical protein